MTLYENWTEILKKAWSVRFMLLAGLFSGIEAALAGLQPVLDEKGVPAGLFAALSGLATAAALVARVVAQANLKDGV